MADAAELKIAVPTTLENEHQNIPLVLVVPEMNEDQLVAQKANRFIHATGKTALQNHVEVEFQTRENLQEPKITSLMDAIKKSREGDKEARKFVTNNVGTDIFERTIKAGLIMKAKLSVDQNGSIMQHGQTMQTTHRNALLYASATPAIMERSKPETRNDFRIDSLYKQDWLNDYYFVTVSRCADNIPFEKLDDNGFFSDTLSASIQATIASQDGLTTESAFVAGVTKPGEDPHDIQTVISFGETLGVDYSGKTAAEIIDTPLLIHKSLMPNGVIDLVQLYDICAGGTFFGEAKPQQDYSEFVEFCRQREQEFGPIVERIVEKLISEASTMLTPLDAIKRLHKLSEEEMLKQSIVDNRINPRVFGSEAAIHIEQARVHHALGNTELAQSATRKALDTARSSSCPGAFLQDKELSEKENNQDTETSEEIDSKTGTIRCIKCRNYVPKEKVVKKDHWECPRCSHKVDICSGEVVREGTIDEPRREKTNVISLFGSKPNKVNTNSLRQAA